MKKAIIFDLDGTLLYTLEDLCDSVNYVLSMHNLKLRTLLEVKGFLGNGMQYLISSAAEENKSSALSKKLHDELVEYYNTHSMIKTKPYDDMINLLDTLKSKGIRLAVCTNKNEEIAKCIIKRYFNGYFECIVGDDRTGRLKPNNYMLNRVLDSLGLSNNDVLYIGDSEVDVLTGINANVDYCAVTYGYRDKEQLFSVGGKNFCEKPLDILKYI